MSRVLFHATPKRNLKQILKRGLLVSKSKGRRLAIWLHTGDCSGWAIEHCAQRHGVAESDVVIVKVIYPCVAEDSYSEHRLRRHGLTGMLYTLVDVPASWCEECSYLQGREWRGTDYAS